MPAHFENSAVATGLEKVIFIPVPKKGSTKSCPNYHTTVLILHAGKVMLKIPQAKNFQMYNLGLQKEMKPEIKLPKFTGS